MKYPGGIIHKHIVPTTIQSEDVKNRINNLVEECLDRIGILNGPAYFQIKLKDNQYPKIIEMTPRLDGCHMWKVIKYYCNVDLLYCSMELLQGNKDTVKHNIEKYNENGNYILEFMCDKPESKCDFSQYNFDNSLETVYYYQNGDTVQDL